MIRLISPIAVAAICASGTPAMALDPVSSREEPFDADLLGDSHNLGDGCRADRIEMIVWRLWALHSPYRRFCQPLRQVADQARCSSL
jgi:hypothetical protein